MPSQHAHARQLAPSTTKGDPNPRRRGAHSSPAKARPSRRDALRDELRRIEADIEELFEDFESQVDPLTRAYTAAFNKLKKLDPSLTVKRDVAEPREPYASRGYIEPRA